MTAEVSPVLQPAVVVNHRPQVEAFLGSMLKLMNYPATLDFKDMPDGALGVAVHFDSELPGIQGTKRTYLVDCMQFLVNKAINRPNVPRRWVNLGINQFPEPRTAQQQKQDVPRAGPLELAPPPSAAPTAPMANPPKGPAAKAPKPAKAPAATPVASAAAARPNHQKTPERGQPQARAHGGQDERSLEVAPDPVWTKLGQSLADKAVKLGRVYALMMVSPENRARLLEATKGMKGVTVKTEGEGHWRRVTFVPEKIAPIIKKLVMPDYDDEDE